MIIFIIIICHQFFIIVVDIHENIKIQAKYFKKTNNWSVISYNCLILLFRFNQWCSFCWSWSFFSSSYSSWNSLRQSFHSFRQFKHEIIGSKTLLNFDVWPAAVDCWANSFWNEMQSGNDVSIIRSHLKLESIWWFSVDFNKIFCDFRIMFYHFLMIFYDFLMVFYDFLMIPYDILTIP